MAYRDGHAAHMGGEKMFLEVADERFVIKLNRNNHRILHNPLLRPPASGLWVMRYRLAKWPSSSHQP